MRTSSCEAFFMSALRRWAACPAARLRPLGHAAPSAARLASGCRRSDASERPVQPQDREDALLIAGAQRVGAPVPADGRDVLPIRDVLRTGEDRDGLAADDEPAVDA